MGRTGDGEHERLYRPDRVAARGSSFLDNEDGAAAAPGKSSGVSMLGEIVWAFSNASDIRLGHGRADDARGTDGRYLKIEMESRYRQRPIFVARGLRQEPETLDALRAWLLDHQRRPSSTLIASPSSPP